MRSHRSWLVIASVWIGLSALALSGLVRCPLAALFQLPCPSCGLTRAARALLEMDVQGAFRANPSFVVVFPALALLVGETFWMAVVSAEKKAAFRRFHRFVLATLVVAVLAECAIWLLRFAGLFGGPVSI